MSDLRGRPDPGPRCDLADVEIWEQLQRALTKLDQAERREGELRWELNNEARQKCVWMEDCERARRERDAARRAIAAGQREIAMYRRIGERAESPAEAQRDALAEALRETTAMLERIDLPEGPMERERFAVARLARIDLDALDQTNKEVRP